MGVTKRPTTDVQIGRCGCIFWWHCLCQLVAVDPLGPILIQNGHKEAHYRCANRQMWLYFLVALLVPVSCSGPAGAHSSSERSQRGPLPMCKSADVVVFFGGIACAS